VSSNLQTKQLNGPDALATTRTRDRYDRLARFYDRMESGAERRIVRTWRSLLWSRVRGEHVLEIGVGTGKNLPYYPAGIDITAIDLSPRMLEHARQRAAELGTNVKLMTADAQALPFPDASFNAVVATFVFCSVPDPVLGLREALRVLKPSGQLLLLEHMLSANRFIRPLMHAANPLVVRVVGANINRETVANVERAGLDLRRIDNLMSDIVKLIEARKLDDILSYQEEGARGWDA
jgi:phosphatidylethanolamine/phosphatidyl-N-methylethanolamine N-methyltransferase